MPNYYNYYIIIQYHVSEDGHVNKVSQSKLSAPSELAERGHIPY